MNKQEILNAIKTLSMSQGFYGRLYNKLTDKSNESKKALEYLAKQNFKDSVDLAMFIEGWE